MVLNYEGRIKESECIPLGSLTSSRQLIVNSVWLEILSLDFLIGAFFGLYTDWSIGKAP